MSGTSDGKPTLIVADTEGIRGQIDGASGPRLSGELLTFQIASQTKTLPVRTILGEGMNGIYETGDTPQRYVQFLRDGTSVVERSDGQFQSGTWRTDGERMLFQVLCAFSLILIG